VTRPHPIAWALGALFVASCWGLDAWILSVVLEVPAGSRWAVVAALACCPVVHMTRGTVDAAGRAAHQALAAALGSFLALMFVCMMSCIV